MAIRVLFLFDINYHKLPTNFHKLLLFYQTTDCSDDTDSFTCHYMSVLVITWPIGE